MMSKIKSRKIANVKVLVGIVLAASLIAVFACEQKQTIKTEATPEEKTETISFQGQPLKVSGDSAIIESLKSLISNEKMGIPPPPPPPPPPFPGGTAKLSSEKDVYTVVELMPVFSGGMKALQDYLLHSVRYPDEAIKKGIHGKVYVSFVVAKDGSVLNAKVVRSANTLLDAEALRVINSMPRWTPGKQGGNDVAVQLTIPILFMLQ